MINKGIPGVQDSHHTASAGRLPRALPEQPQEDQIHVRWGGGDQVVNALPIRNTNNQEMVVAAAEMIMWSQEKCAQPATEIEQYHQQNEQLKQQNQPLQLQATGKEESQDLRQENNNASIDKVKYGTSSAGFQESEGNRLPLARQLTHAASGPNETFGEENAKAQTTPKVLSLPCPSPLKTHHNPPPTDETPEVLKKYISEKDKEITILKEVLAREKNQLKMLQQDCYEKERKQNELQTELDRLQSSVAFKDRDLMEIEQEMEKMRNNKEVCDKPHSSDHALPAPNNCTQICKEDSVDSLTESFDDTEGTNHVHPHTKTSLPHGNDQSKGATTFRSLKKEAHQISRLSSSGTLQFSQLSQLSHLSPAN